MNRSRPPFGMGYLIGVAVNEVQYRVLRRRVLRRAAYFTVTAANRDRLARMRDEYRQRRHEG